MAKKYNVPRVSRPESARERQRGILNRLRKLRPEPTGEDSPMTKPSLGDRARGTRSSRQGGRALAPRRRRRRGMKNGRAIPSARDLRAARRNQERAARRGKDSR